MSIKIEAPSDWETDQELSGTFSEVRPDELSRAYREFRFNPHHGKDGKFASSNGFKAGAWTGDDEKSQIASHEHVQMQLHDSFLAQGMTPLQAKELAARQADTLGYVFVNGNVTVAMTKGASMLWSPSDRADFLGDVDEMQTRFPLKGDVHITVMGDSAFPQIPGGVVQGETARLGEGTMRFNADGIKKGSPLLPPDDVGQKFHAPGYAEAGAMKYTVAHEWGHATDTWHNGTKYLASKEATKKGLTSEYGATNANEAYAEAFASWALKGDQSPVGAYYDSVFHWSDKYGGSK